MAIGFVRSGKPETYTNATNGRGGGLGVGAKRARACRGRGTRHARAVAAARTPFVRLLQTDERVARFCGYALSMESSFPRGKVSSGRLFRILSHIQISLDKDVPTSLPP